ncbi:hypothetical protein MUK42_23211, partial [Musa troglodytarum]
MLESVVNGTNVNFVFLRVRGKNRRCRQERTKKECAYQQHKHRFLFLGRDDSKQTIAISSAAFAPLLLHPSPSFLADQRRRLRYATTPEASDEAHGRAVWSYSVIDSSGVVGFCSDTCGGEHKKGSGCGGGVERRFARWRRWSITRNQRQRRPQCCMQQLWSPCRHHFSCLRHWRCHCEFHVDLLLVVATER